MHQAFHVEMNPLAARSGDSVDFRFRGVMLRSGNAACFLRLLNSNRQYVNLLFGVSSVAHGQDSTLVCSISNWSYPAGTYEVLFSDINGTAFVHVVPAGLHLSLSVIDIHAPPDKLSLLGEGFTPELCVNTRLFLVGTHNRSFCTLVFTSIHECRCDVFDPDAASNASVYVGLQEGNQTLLWNISNLPWASVTDVYFAPINQQPFFLPKSLTLIMNDVDCQNFSMNLGVVSPGRHIESQQTLSVVVLSFTSAVRPFDVPASMYIQDFHVFLNFSLPVQSGNVSIIFEVQDSGGTAPGGMNRTQVAITILFLASPRSPNVQTSLNFDFIARFPGDSSPNEEIYFMLNFGRQRSEDAFTVYRLLGCSDTSLFELQPHFLSPRSCFFDSSSGTGLSMSANVTYCFVLFLMPTFLLLWQLRMLLLKFLVSAREYLPVMYLRSVLKSSMYLLLLCQVNKSFHMLVCFETELCLLVSIP
jgi:hypothetical protein